MRPPTPTSARRRGGILPLVALGLIGLTGVMALAIDVGMMALARNQAQAAADTAAMAAVRELNGDTANNNNYDAAEPAAKSTAAANQVLGRNLDPDRVQVAIGYYSYNTTTGLFDPSFTGSKPAGENWSAVRVDVEAFPPSFFARVFNIQSFTIRASSTAVHRPRDIALILDFSGSMRFSSLSAYPYWGDKSGSMNPDPAFPKFGHWSVMADVMYRDTAYVGGGTTIAPNNFTVATENGPPIVKDFLTRDSMGNLVSAFDQTTSPYDPMVWACPAPQDWDVQSDDTVTYAGDKWPRVSQSTTGAYAKTVQEFLFGNNNTQSSSHARSTADGPGGGNFDPADPNDPQSDEGYGPNFKGYSMGPGYYGKTFYIWPPDPRFHPTDASLQLDWRKRFFLHSDDDDPVDDNTHLWDSSGYWRQAGQSSSYDVNYDAVIQWIKAGPQVFPPNLRAGRLLYYDSIPDTIPQNGGTADQRFWRGYIDYVIGTGSSNDQQAALYGRETNVWGTGRITSWSSLRGPDGTPGTGDEPYMHYNDNPRRPRLHFWFGPLSMLDFMSRYTNNWLPGTSHEAQTWQLKAGIQSALRDIEKNHPNDAVALIYFSSLSSYKTARVPMGRNYGRLKDALFFPFDMLDDLGDPLAERRPYQNNDSLSWDVEGIVPSASGGTSPEMGLKVAYNEFGNANGAKGRQGAAKVVILETDGVPNSTADSSFVNNGTYQSYYNLSGDTDNYGNNNSTVLSRALGVVDQICALGTANPPGYAKSKSPVRVHALAFGDLFQQSGSDTQNALDFLLQVQKHGNTSASSATSIESYKIITGDFDTRIGNLRTAMERIMQSGIQVALIR